jgi:hypothetical protein
MIDKETLYLARTLTPDWICWIYEYDKEMTHVRDQVSYHNNWKTRTRYYIKYNNVYESFNYCEQMQARFVAGTYLLVVKRWMTSFLNEEFDADKARLSEETR